MGRIIDTDAAYTVLTDYYHHGTDTQHAALKEALEMVPTVDAVPVRHGRWERHYCEDDGLPDGWQCSACSEWYFFDNKPNFCPHCGAKMNGRDGDRHDEP